MFYACSTLPIHVRSARSSFLQGWRRGMLGSFTREQTVLRKKTLNANVARSVKTRRNGYPPILITWRIDWMWRVFATLNFAWSSLREIAAPTNAMARPDAPPHSDRSKICSAPSSWAAGGTALPKPAESVPLLSHTARNHSLHLKLLMSETNK